MSKTLNRFPGLLEAENGVHIYPSGSQPTMDGQIFYISGSGFRFFEEGIVRVLEGGDLHNDMNGLQGGTSPDEYYHLPLDKYLQVISASLDVGVSASNVAVDTSQFTDRLAGVTPQTAQAMFVKLDETLATGFAAGPITPGVLTINTSSMIASITNGQVNVYKDSNFGGDLRTYNIPSSSFSLIDDATNYIIAKYNSGNPIYSLTTNVDLINESDVVPVYTIVRSGSNTDYISWDTIGRGMLNRLHQRTVKVNRFIRESGLMISEAAVRRIQISTGVVWYGVNKITSNAVDSATDLIRHFYNNGLGGWSTMDMSTYVNDQYDNGSGLQTLGNNKFVVNWVFKSLGDDDISIVLSDQYNTLAEAGVAKLPGDLPMYMTSLSIFVGRIIAQQGVAFASQIDSAFTVQLGFAAVTMHNNLAGLQGGTPSQFYHLTSQQNTDIELVTSSSWDAMRSSPSQEPLGWVDRTSSDINWDNSTHTLTLSVRSPATEYVVWETTDNGSVKHTFTSSMSSSIDTPEEGLWWFYILSGSLINLAVDNVVNLPRGVREVLTANVFLTSSLDAITVGDERHGTTMDWATHLYLHTTVGTAYRSGFGLERLTTGSLGLLNSDTQISLESGIICDEDIIYDINRVSYPGPFNAFEQELGSGSSVPGRFPIFFKTGSISWDKLDATVYPAHRTVGAPRLCTNMFVSGSWEMTHATADGNYICMFIVGTNSFFNPVISIMGQSEFTSLYDALNYAFSDLSLLPHYPVQEFKPLYKLIYRTDSSYPNDLHASIVLVIDYRSVPTATIGKNVQSHLSLADVTVFGTHPASAIQFDTTFSTGSSILTSEQTSLQSTVQQLNTYASSITGSTYTGAVRFNAGLSGSLTKLTDGSSYITSTGGTSLTTQSNGSLLISSSVPYTAHSQLSGLLNDDHPQYFRTDGTRVLSGTLDLGGNNIINVGGINGLRNYGALVSDPTDPPPSGGDKYYNSVDWLEMMYDPIRAKWLSVSSLSYFAGAQGSTSTGSFFKGPDGLTFGQNIGLIVPKGTVTMFGTTKTSSGTSIIEAVVNDETVAALTASSPGVTFDFSMNSDFNQGMLQFRNSSSGSNDMTDVMITLVMRRRT